MSEERLELIKENVYMRSEIATISGIGIESSLKEELELIEEIDRLNNIINGLEKHLNQEIIEWQDANDLWTKAQVQEDRVVLNKLKELKDSD